MPRKYRQNRKYRRNRFNAKGKGAGLKIFFPALIFITIISIVGLFLYFQAGCFFKNFSFFNVARVELTMKPFLKDALSLDFYNIPHHFNIFQLNIDAVGVNTQKKHPEFKTVIVSRRPPNVINVRIEYKEPVVFIKARPQSKFLYDRNQIFYPQWKGYALVPVSCDGVILPAETATGKILPILSGVDFNSSVIKVGGVCSDKKLPYGVKLLISLNSLWRVKGHRIDVLDITNTRAVSIFLENGVEVKLGEGGIQEKLTTLSNLLKFTKFDFTKIKYIDLRFSNAIIVPNEQK